MPKSKKGGFMGLFKTRRKRDKAGKAPRKGHATLKKKYQKICKRECKKEYPIDFCDYQNNICSWYDADYNRDCNVKSFYKQVSKEDLKNGAIIKKYVSKNGCAHRKNAKIVRLK
jgi:hypothetical protein